MTNTPPKISRTSSNSEDAHDVKSTSRTLGLRNRSSALAVNTDHDRPGPRSKRRNPTMSAPQSRVINAVVLTAGLMEKTVKVRIGGQKWNKHVRKYFNHPQTFLVHDPRSSLRAGDIIEISSGWRVSKNVRHVVNRIIAPFGEPIEARPSVMTEVERLEERRLKKEAKELRRAKIGTEEKIEKSA